MDMENLPENILVKIANDRDYGVYNDLRNMIVEVVNIKVCTVANIDIVFYMVRNIDTRRIYQLNAGLLRKINSIP